ncbi:MAG TPA: lipid-binding SYLF domain-containing protein [Bryobacteraceae bacterium]|jgi:lipid-binding SYLF domain-containing protein
MRFALLSLCLALPLLADSPLDEHNRRIRESAGVLDEIMNAGDKSIPRDLLEKAQCVGIVPNLKRAGFIVGGQYGKGVLTCRVRDAASGWSAPSTIRVEGGSFGLQIGAGETDLVFIVMNQSGMNRLMKDKFTVGGDATVMAGPVGRSTDAKTDAALKAEILAYSRAHGVFAGVSLEGSTLRADNDDNTKIYGKDVTQEAILHGHVKSTVEAKPLFEELNKWAAYKHD